METTKSASELESLFDRELIKNSSEAEEHMQFYGNINTALEALVKAADLLERTENKKTAEAITLILENLAAKVLEDIKK